MIYIKTFLASFENIIKTILTIYSLEGRGLCAEQASSIPHGHSSQIHHCKPNQPINNYRDHNNNDCILHEDKDELK